MIDQLTVQEYQKEDTKVLAPLYKALGYLVEKMNCKADSGIFLLIQLTAI